MDYVIPLHGSVHWFYSYGMIKLNLMTSKIRVAPIKGRTIPGLKLRGAIILACLMYLTYGALHTAKIFTNMVESHLSIKTNPSTL